MELKGKKIAFLGDSITEGVGVSSVEKIYWNLVGQRTGAEVYGYGIGGTRIAVNRQPNHEPHVEENYFGARVEKMIPDADIVVVFGGTNDFGHGVFFAFCFDIAACVLDVDYTSEVRIAQIVQSRIVDEFSLTEVVLVCVYFDAEFCI